MEGVGTNKGEEKYGNERGNENNTKWKAPRKKIVKIKKECDKKRTGRRWNEER